MKIPTYKICCLVFLFIACKALNAQLEKKTWLTSGSGSVSFVKDEVYDYVLSSATDWSELKVDAEGSLGYFIVNQFSLGLKLYTAYRKGVTGDDGFTLSFNQLFLAVGPNLRYYCFEFRNNLAVYLDLSYLKGGNFLFGTPFSGKPGQYDQAIALAGLEYFINSTIGIHFNLGYKHTLENYNDIHYWVNRNQSGLNWNLGFSLHLIKK